MSVRRDIKRNKTETEIKLDIWSNKLCFSVCMYTFFLKGKEYLEENHNNKD